MKMHINPAYTGLRPEILRLVPDGAVDVLDVGCSTGILGQELKSRVPSRCVSGIEIDFSSYIIAKGRLDRVYQADINTFEWKKHFKHNSFDCIIFADTLEHLVDPWKVLQEATHILKPKGSIIISLPNIRHISALWSIYVQGSFPRRERGIHDSTHLRWFTRKDLESLCKHAGLRCEEVRANYRIGDSPESPFNGILRLLKPFVGFRLFSEFLAYQHIVRAVKW